ncbi:MAG TPA: DUF488 family protein [Candidatus Bathyarchaeia archaeon]
MVILTGKPNFTHPFGVLSMPIFLKRAYEKAASEDGKRILVERLWPRGLRRENARIDEWLRNLAPSTNLRKWYQHDPSKWEQFKEKYWKELQDKETELVNLAKEAAQRNITFVYGSREEKMNNAVALKMYVETKLKNLSEE